MSKPNFAGAATNLISIAERYMIGKTVQLDGVKMVVCQVCIERGTYQIHCTWMKDGKRNSEWFNQTEIDRMMVSTK